jgi:hypothetical protein
MSRPAGVRWPAVAAIGFYVGSAITIALGVGGWIVAQAQARRTRRSDMRITYLLDAYRRLDRAANRALSADTAGDIEAAIRDIMLLGSPSQVELANEFGRVFADKRDAEAKPLLMDLRASLRRELLLDSLPPAAYMALRITDQGEAAENHARIWRDVIEGTRQSVNRELAGRVPGSDLAPAAEAYGPDSDLSPSAVVASSFREVEVALRDLLTTASPDGLTELNLAQLANRALELKLIDTQLADSLNGFSVMRLLSAMNPERTDHAKAAEFSNLATALLYLLRRP